MAESAGIVWDGLRRGWWLLLLALAGAVAVAAWATNQETPQFAAEALLIVVPDRDLEDPSDILRTLDTLDRRTVLATMAEIPGRAETKSAAGRELGWDTSDLRRYWIGGSVVPQTNLLRIEVRGPEAEPVARLATATARATGREADRLYPVYSFRLLEEAEVPRDPLRPAPGRSLTVAGILGLFLGALAALCLELYRRRNRDRP
ncbi:MAG: hypothetical protein R3234_12900 [Thermoanaerobaculia bacterium]|nr:hypothetical protein [Thermoanaerobaculia bacterium]